LWAYGNDTCIRKCVEKIVETFDYAKQCKSCPIECDSVSYRASTEYSDISDYLKNFPIRNLTERFANYRIDSIIKNLSILNFNYESMEYTQIKEMPRTTFVSLIGELGGTVGKKSSFNFTRFWVYF